MSLELWNTVGTLGTFLVIAATAVAALVQLRHMRRSNQIAALSELFEKANIPESIAARHFVFSGLAAKMQDPAFRYEVVNRAARTRENAEAIGKAVIVGSYYEEMGLLAKAGLVDRDLVCDMHGEPLIALWNALLEFTAIGRERNPELLENFEYLVVLAQDWHAKHPAGSYPPNVRRLDVPNKWRATDEGYAASRAKPPTE